VHQSLEVLYKLCVFYFDRNSKMTTTAGHSFYIGPIGFFYNQVNDTGSWEPLVGSQINLFCQTQIKAKDKQCYTAIEVVLTISMLEFLIDTMFQVCPFRSLFFNKSSAYLWEHIVSLSLLIFFLSTTRVGQYENFKYKIIAKA
jgi:hypothetical protein